MRQLLRLWYLLLLGLSSCVPPLALAQGAALTPFNAATSVRVTGAGNPAYGSAVVLCNSKQDPHIAYLLTNRHVVADAGNIDVLVAGAWQPAEIWIWDREDLTDLAMLRLQTQGRLVGLPLAQQDPQLGERVQVLAHSPIRHATVNGAVWDYGVSEKGPDFGIKTATPVYPGDSGSGVINARGELVGVFWGAPSDRSSARFGVAVPVSQVHAWLARHRDPDCAAPRPTAPAPKPAPAPPVDAPVPPSRYERGLPPAAPATETSEPESVTPPDATPPAKDSPAQSIPIQPDGESSTPDPAKEQTRQPQAPQPALPPTAEEPLASVPPQLPQQPAPQPGPVSGSKLGGIISWIWNAGTTLAPWAIDLGTLLLGGGVAGGGVLAGVKVVSAIARWWSGSRSSGGQSKGGGAATCRAPFPRALDETRQLLQLRQTEGRVAALDALRGMFLEDEATRLLAASDVTPEQKTVIRLLRDRIDSHVDEVAPISTSQYLPN